MKPAYQVNSIALMFIRIADGSGDYMHDQRALLEIRLTRFVTEHLQPALYRDGSRST